MKTVPVTRPINRRRNLLDNIYDTVSAAETPSFPTTLPENPLYLEREFALFIFGLLIQISSSLLVHALNRGLTESYLPSRKGPYNLILPHSWRECTSRHTYTHIDAEMRDITVEFKLLVFTRGFTAT